jgi:signal transduction histidine kinase
MKKLTNYLKRLKSSIDNHFEMSTPPILIFGLFGTINFPLFYFIWRYVTPNENSDFFMRIIATILCLFLVLKDYWPKQLRPYLAIYWYFTVTFTLPFFGMYSFLENQGSAMWLTNIMLVLFWMTLSLDWLSFIILLMTGLLAGILTYHFTQGPIHVKSADLFPTIINYLWAIVTAAAFSHNREKLQIAKLHGMQTLSATIAHELRTPLRAISSSASSVAKYLDNLIASYRIAKEQKLNVPYISGLHLKSLAPAFESIEAEAKSAFTFIDMLLVKVSQDTTKSSPLEICSIATCIEEALHRYPFSPGEIELVRWQRNDNFQFQGNFLLIIHVIFNLFKNALYYIQAARKGDINIWVSTTEQHNFLHFKDTATGIASSILPYIFDRFVSHTYHGTGIGLAFCKYVMKSFDGNITCNSVEGEYTEFKLAFPKYYIDNKP